MIKHQRKLTKMKLILSDVDGVLVSWIEGFDALMEKYGYPRVIENEYNLAKAFATTKDVIDKVAHEYVTSDVIANLHPIRDSVNVIRFLNQKHGYKLHCITSISSHPVTHEYRLLNLQHLYGKDAIHELDCVDHNYEKQEHLEKYRDSGLFWIEDHYENYDFGVKMGLKSILMDQPWNKEYQEVKGTRVKDWHEIAKKILENENDR